MLAVNKSNNFIRHTSRKPEWLEPQDLMDIEHSGKRMLEHISVDYGQTGNADIVMDKRTGRFEANWQNTIGSNANHYSLIIEALASPDQVQVRHCEYATDSLYASTKFIRKQNLDLETLKKEVRSYPSLQEKSDYLLSVIRFNQRS